MFGASIWIIEARSATDYTALDGGKANLTVYIRSSEEEKNGWVSRILRNVIIVRND